MDVKRDGKSISAYALAAAFCLLFITNTSKGESLSYAGKLPPTRSLPLAWGKDPFVPALKVTGAPPDLRLTAIFYNPRNPSAIINDRIVYIGGVVKGQKVIDIGRTHVILQGENGQVKIQMADVPELHNAGR
ncbi:MAG: hypothetical protein HY891_09665 [Deltaproteobacteria bacterium]|nr:hypothetical protein [Deltaproteobacteria bacterium]